MAHRKIWLAAAWMPALAMGALALTLGGGGDQQTALAAQDDWLKPATSSQDRQPDAQAPNPKQFWKSIKDAEYRNWWPWPGQSSDFYEGTRPHGAKLKVYVNRNVAGDLKQPPAGSIIIKENYTPEKKLAAITVMKRVEGFDPENGNWWWVKYQPDGTVATQNGMQVAGKVASCIACHKTAGGGDYIFANDESE